MSPRNWSYPIFTHTHIHIEDRYYIYNVGILLQNSVQHNAMQCHALYLMNIYTQYPTCFSWSSFGQQHVPCVFFEVLHRGTMASLPQFAGAGQRQVIQHHYGNEQHAGTHELWWGVLNCYFWMIGNNWTGPEYILYTIKIQWEITVFSENQIFIICWTSPHSPFSAGNGATTWIFLALSVASIMFGWWIDQAFFGGTFHRPVVAWVNIWKIQGQVLVWPGSCFWYVQYWLL